MLPPHEVEPQAEQFVSYYQKGFHRTFEEAFEFWADSKDFWPRDRLAIRIEVFRLLGFTADDDQRQEEAA
jgi:hypothetical protein